MNDEELLRHIELSNAGSLESTLFLYDFYSQNNEPEKAFESLKRIESINNIEINKRLGSCYEKGIGIISDPEMAKYYYRKAFESGDTSSGFNLALLFYNNKEYEKSVPYLMAGVSNNHIQSIKMLANFYYSGLGVVKDDEIALNLFKKLSTLNLEQYDLVIGSLLYNLKRYDEAFGYLNKCFLNQNYGSCSLLADCYFFGFGTTQNKNTAINILKDGQKHDDEKSIIKLSKCFEHGIGVEKDIEYANYLKTKIHK